jgi:hypothetical protein
MSNNKNYDDLYESCQTGDFDSVKRLLPLLSFEELHHRVEPIEYFVMVPSLLAIAWLSKNDHIARYLPMHKNKHHQTRMSSVFLFHQTLIVFEIEYQLMP